MTPFRSEVWRNSVVLLAALLTTAIACSAQVSVLTQHNDNFRTGLNPAETILTTSNVNVDQFGKLYSLPVDGQVYAQPLYVPNVTFPGNVLHNVLVIATENDSVYAFDADATSVTSPLWKVSLVDPAHGGLIGETPVLNATTVDMCPAISPTVGVTSAPVIDPTTTPTATIYVEAKSVNGSTYIHRLHALDITTGAEKSQGPVLITATVSGSGEGSVNGLLTFDPLREFNRPGLLLLNGNIYIAYSSVCFADHFHGWVFAYDASSFAQKSVFVTTPNGELGGIWMSGTGLAADTNGFIYLASGDGSYDANIPTTDFGDSILKLSTTSGQKSGSLSVTDYFTPFDQGSLFLGDEDLGSGGVLLLPDQPGNHPHMLVEAGKEGRIYLVDRDQMTSDPSNPGQREPYCSPCTSDPQIVQESPFFIGGDWGMPAYWNNHVYYWTNKDVLRSIPLSNGIFDFADMTTGAITASYPGATPAVSSNGTTPGTAILWALNSSSDKPAVLYAYDASNISNFLWSSSQAANGRDQAEDAARFDAPTIANGKVYVGTSTTVAVYGLLPSVNPPSVTLSQGQTQQFWIAAQNQSVTWSVSPTVGNISGTGLYTAPTTIMANQIVDVIATDSTGTVVGSAIVNLTAPHAAATATFVTSDSSTQGNWRGVYGGDGYSIAQDSQALPPYASFNVQSQSNYTWDANPTDPRALERGNTAGRIAASWYSGSTFSFDVNFSDGNSHRLALYALDWDSSGRSETIQIIDASTGILLDSESVSSSTNGTYLVWNVSGHVTVSVIRTAGPNSAVSGVFFGPGRLPTSVTVSINPPSANLTGSQSQQFTATITGDVNQVVTWSYGPTIGTLTTSGAYTAPEGVSPQAITVTATSVEDTTKSASAIVNLGGGASATFVGTDTKTQGSWRGVYGSDGYFVANDSQAVPTYATFALLNPENIVWAFPTTDPRALQQGNDSGRIAGAWVNALLSLTFDVNITDGNLHQLSLYAVDWNNQGLSQTIQIVDAVSNSVLSSQTVTNFGSGVYFIWNISGHVKIVVRSTGDLLPVISGAFFDSANSSNKIIPTINWPTPAPIAYGTALSATQLDATASVQGTFVYTPGAGAVLSPGSQTLSAEFTPSDATDYASASASVTLTVDPVASSNQAVFIQTDISTQGNWHGVYGSDGYSVANDTQSIPSYATFTVQNQSNYTWVSNPADVRALQNGANTGRIASAWYANPGFNIDLNFVDGNTHQFALYALDWDSGTRAEKIQIVDGATNATLDSRTISGFSGGVYLVWNVSGHVKINVTMTAGANAVLSGAFFGGTSGSTKMTPTITWPTPQPVVAGTALSGTQLDATASVPGTFVYTPPAGTVMTAGSQTLSTTFTPNDATDYTTATGQVTLVVNSAVTGNSISVISGTPQRLPINTPFSSLQVKVLQGSQPLSGATVTFTAPALGATGTFTGGVLSTTATTNTNGIATAPTFAANGIAGATYVVSASVSGASSNAVFWLTNTAGAGAAAFAWGDNEYGQLGDGTKTQRNAPVQVVGSGGTGSFPNALSLSGGDEHSLALEIDATGWAWGWALEGQLGNGTYNDSNSAVEVIDSTGAPFSGLVAVAAGEEQSMGLRSDGTVWGWGNNYFGQLGYGQTAIYTNTPVQASGITNAVAIASGAFYSLALKIDGTVWGWGENDKGQLGNGTFSNTNIPVQVVNSGGAAFSGVVAIAGGTSHTLALKSDGTVWAWGDDSFGQLGNGAISGANTPVQVITSTGAPLSGIVAISAGAFHSLALKSDGTVWSWGLGIDGELGNGGSADSSFPVQVVAPSGSGAFSSVVAIAGGYSHSLALRSDGTVWAWGSNTNGQLGNGTTTSSKLPVQVSTLSGVVSISAGFYHGLALATSNTISAPPAFTSAATTTFTVGTSGTFTVSASGNPAPALSMTGTLPNGVTFTPSTGLLSGVPTTNAGTPYQVTFTAGNGVLPNATQTFTLNVNPQQVSGGSAAQFIHFDTSTAGNWQNNYGGDGYSVANGTQVVPSYLSSLAVQSGTAYTWVANSTDPRALQTASGRMASAWYSASTFDFDVPVTDTNTHQVALYLLDWDSSLRTETVQIRDATTNAVLDTETASSFHNGAYAVWNISGHVKIFVTGTGGANAVVSGIFFGGANSNSNPAPLLGIAKTHSGNFTQGQQGPTYTVTVSNSGNAATSGVVTVTETVPTGLTLVSMAGTGWTCPANNTTCTRSDALLAGSSYQPITVTVNVAANATSPQVNQVSVSGGGSVTGNASDSTTIGGAAAQFVKRDTTTLGNWQGVYGANGYSLATVAPPVIPSFATFAMQNQVNYVWAATTTDTRAPLIPGSTSQRTAATWYNYPSFSFDLNFTDGNAHSFALYGLDWDKGGRSENIQIYDAGSNALLDTETLSNFSGGVYLVWNVTGHVRIVVTSSAGPNCVVSGVFFN